MSMMGSTIPLARTAAERAAKGDPRPSIAERYGSRDRYLTLVREAATRLVTARHALAEDVDAMVSRAGVLWDFVHRATVALPPGGEPVVDRLAQTGPRSDWTCTTGTVPGLIPSRSS